MKDRNRWKQERKKKREKEKSVYNRRFHDSKHEKTIIERTLDICLMGSNSSSIFCLRPLSHRQNTRVVVRRYRTPSHTTITRLTVDKPWAMGGTEGVRLDDIGHVQSGVEVVELMVSVGDVGS